MASSLGYGSSKRSSKNPASISLFSHELSVHMKTGIRKGVIPSLTSGGEEPLLDLALPSDEVVSDP
jgi:hypothetical protein